MREIKVKNDLDVKVYINGVPDYRLIIEDKTSGFLEALELHISEYYKKKKNVPTKKVFRKIQTDRKMSIGRQSVLRYFVKVLVNVAFFHIG